MTLRNQDGDRHMEIAWKGLAKELHGLLCEAVEWNWLDDDAGEVISRYDEIMERVNEEWDSD